MVKRLVVTALLVCGLSSCALTRLHEENQREKAKVAQDALDKRWAARESNVEARYAATLAKLGAEQTADKRAREAKAENDRVPPRPKAVAHPKVASAQRLPTPPSIVQPPVRSGAFYDPERAKPYQPNETMTVQTYDAAIHVLAEEFGQSASWVEANMGSANDIRAIHSCLASAKEHVGKARAEAASLPELKGPFYDSPRLPRADATTHERYFRDSKGSIVSESFGESNLSEVRRDVAAMPDGPDKAFAGGFLRALENEWARMKRESEVPWTQAQTTAEPVRKPDSARSEAENPAAVLSRVLDNAEEAVRKEQSANGLRKRPEEKGYPLDIRKQAAVNLLVRDHGYTREKAEEDVKAMVEQDILPDPSVK